MIHKTLIANVKAVDEAEGIVEAYVNTMGIADAGGSTVTAVDIATTGDTWEIGKQIDLYGVKL